MSNGAQRFIAGSRISGGSQMQFLVSGGIGLKLLLERLEQRLVRTARVWFELCQGQSCTPDLCQPTRRQLTSKVLRGCFIPNLEHRRLWNCVAQLAWQLTDGIKNEVRRRDVGADTNGNQANASTPTIEFGTNLIGIFA